MELVLRVHVLGHLHKVMRPGARVGDAEIADSEPENLCRKWPVNAVCTPIFGIPSTNVASGSGS